VFWQFSISMAGQHVRGFVIFTFLHVASGYGHWTIPSRHQPLRALSLAPKRLRPAVRAALNDAGGNDAVTATTESGLFRGRLAIMSAALMIGSNTPILKTLYLMPDPPSASALSCARGVLNAIVLLPTLWLVRTGADGKKSTRVTPRLILAAAELALYNFADHALLNVGLADGGSATKAAFLVESSVIFTPMIAFALGNAVDAPALVGGALAFVGLAFLALGDPMAVQTLSAASIDRNDLLFIMSALFWSLTIIRLGAISESDELADSFVQVQAAKSIFLAFAYGAWLAVDVASQGGGLQAQWAGDTRVIEWVLVGCSAIGEGLLGDIFQAFGQRTVTPTEANTLLTTEPLWAVGLTALFLHERLTTFEYVGGAVLVVAALVASQSQELTPKPVAVLLSPPDWRSDGPDDI
jgi:drug/metabolite transporter (DMT)-like permease